MCFFFISLFCLKNKANGEISRLKIKRSQKCFTSVDFVLINNLVQYRCIYFIVNIMPLPITGMIMPLPRHDIVCFDHKPQTLKLFEALEFYSRRSSRLEKISHTNLGSASILKRFYDT